jgi:hypothetical protein
MSWATHAIKAGEQVTIHPRESPRPNTCSPTNRPHRVLLRQGPNRPGSPPNCSRATGPASISSKTTLSPRPRARLPRKTPPVSVRRVRQCPQWPARLPQEPPGFADPASAGSVVLPLGETPVSRPRSASRLSQESLRTTPRKPHKQQKNNPRCFLTLQNRVWDQTLALKCLRHLKAEVGNP